MSVTRGGALGRRSGTRRTSDPARLHVVQATGCRVQGGGEVIVGALARGLTRRGAAVSVICGSLEATVDAGSTLPIVIPISVRCYPLAVARFARLLNRLDPDVVHVHDQRSMLVAAAAARLRPVPAIVRTYHALSRARAAGRGRGGRAALALADKVAGFVARRSLDHGVAFTEAGSCDVVCRYGLRADSVSAIPNGVDTDRFKPLVSSESRGRLRAELGFGSADILVGAVGRLVTVKGHRVLLDAFERLAREEPRAGLVLAGDGPLREELNAAKRASEAGRRIRLVGERVIDANFYGSLDLFAYPSVAGAYGLVVLEAMACGLPVVASRLQGTDELIEDGENGLLVSPADPSALATSLLRLVMSAAERRRLGDQARRVAMQYSETAMVERYEALYRSLLDRPAGPVAEAPAV